MVCIPTGIVNANIDLTSGDELILPDESYFRYKLVIYKPNKVEITKAIITPPT